MQTSFALRIAAMARVDPQSTSFQRSKAWRVLTEEGRILWSQQWVPYGWALCTPDYRSYHPVRRPIFPLDQDIDMDIWSETNRPEPAPDAGASLS